MPATKQPSIQPAGRDALPAFTAFMVTTTFLGFARGTVLITNNTTLRPWCVLRFLCVMPRILLFALAGQNVILPSLPLVYIYFPSVPGLTAGDRWLFSVRARRQRDMVLDKTGFGGRFFGWERCGAAWWHNMPPDCTVCSLFNNEDRTENLPRRPYHPGPVVCRPPFDTLRSLHFSVAFHHLPTFSPSHTPCCVTSLSFYCCVFLLMPMPLATSLKKQATGGGAGGGLTCLCNLYLCS